MTEDDKGWFGPDTATFGDRMAGAREAAGMSQAQLAKRLGVKKSTVLAWEEDMSEPRANRLVMLAGLLNVSVMWLITGEGEGVTGPVSDAPDAPDCREILAELSVVRVELRTAAERAARLERRLRRLLNEREEA